MKKKRVFEPNEQLLLKLYDFKNKGVSYVDALIELHHELDIEMEDFMEMLPDNIINEIKIEFVQKRMVKNDDIQRKVDLRDHLGDIMDFLDDEGDCE